MLSETAVLGKMLKSPSEEPKVNLAVHLSLLLYNDSSQAGSRLIFLILSRAAPWLGGLKPVLSLLPGNKTPGLVLS